MNSGHSPSEETQEDLSSGLAFSYWVSAEGLRKLLLRMIWGMAIGGTTFAGYLLLQRVSIRPVLWLEPSPLEKWIGASNGAPAVYLYLSFYLLILIPGLLPSDRQFRRFLIALALTGFVSLVVFLLVPSGVQRPQEFRTGASGAYLRLIHVDLPRNAFPSLHASVTILAAIVGGIVLRGWPARLLFWAWAAGVLWSTMATRQHVLFDVVSGALLACISWIVAARLLKAREGSLQESDAVS